MAKKEKLNELTKEWFLTVLYDGSRDLAYLMENGCKVMIYGHDTYEEIENIIKELVTENKIRLDPSYKTNNETYLLTGKGSFFVKKNTILPLLKIATDHKYKEAFIEANKEKCDINFLENMLTKDEKNIESWKIRDYALSDFLSLKNILKCMSHFLFKNDEFNMDNTSVIPIS